MYMNYVLQYGNGHRIWLKLTGGSPYVPCPNYLYRGACESSEPGYCGPGPNQDGGVEPQQNSLL